MVKFNHIYLFISIFVFVVLLWCLLFYYFILWIHYYYVGGWVCGFVFSVLHFYGVFL
jgi:hypothetical protein